MGPFASKLLLGWKSPTYGMSLLNLSLEPTPASNHQHSFCHGRAWWDGESIQDLLPLPTWGQLGPRLLKPSGNAVLLTMYCGHLSAVVPTP